MSSNGRTDKVVSAERVVEAPARAVFELVADPAQQPRWDGNDNLAQADEGQRVRAVGEMFTMVLTRDAKVRENHVVEFEEGRVIAWRPAEPGARPPGHLWRWELEPLGEDRTLVRHTYDWTRLEDPSRFERARATTSERLLASIDRLAALAEGEGEGTSQDEGQGRGTAADRTGQAGQADPLDLVRHLHEQLDWHWQVHARPRLEGMGDEEYLWEPAPGTWSVRRREDEAPSTVTMRVGSGDRVIDVGIPEPEPSPVTSIAWRLAHVIVGVLGARAHAHFDGPPAAYETWEYAATAAEAVAQLDDVYAAWSEGVRSLRPEDLTRPVGEAEGDWAEHPMLELVLHINRETIHHLAEVALLRDLWAHRDGGGAAARP